MKVPGGRSIGLHDARVYSTIAIVILCGAILIRLIGLDKGMWLEESLSINTVSGDYQLRDLRTPPLYFVLLWVWARISMNEQFLRLLSVAFGVGTVIVLMLWLKRYSALASLIGGLLCATMPIMLRYSQEIRAYPLLLFATALAFFFASGISAGSEKLSSYLGLAISLGIAVSTHMVGVMLITTIGLFIVVSVGDYRRIQWRKLLVSLALPSIIFAFLFFFFLRRVPDQSSWWMPPFSLDLAATTAKLVFGVSALFTPVRWLENYAALAVLSDRLIKAVLVGCFLTLGLLGNWRRTWPLLAAALAFWLQLALYSIFLLPIFWYRTVLPGLVPLIGFVSLQAATIRVRLIKRGTMAGLGLVILCFFISWVAVEARTPYEQWKQASQFLESQRQPSDLVIFYPSYVEGAVEYYAPDLQPQDVILVQLGMDIDEIVAEIEGRVKTLEERGVRPVIFVVMRADVNLDKEAQTRDGLLAFLESRFGPKLISEQFSQISVSGFGRR
jgi:hypothetical protein